MKILYVTTISNTINAFMIPHIRLLLDQGHQVDIACNINKNISIELTERGCRVFNISFQRSPLSRENYGAYKQLRELILKEQYELVHTHTPIASACVRLACKKMKNVKVVYTAHGFHFFKKAPLSNWLVYYPIERYLAKYTDVLITINKEDYERAKRSFKAKEVRYIPGVGIDTKGYIEYKSINKDKKREELGIPNETFTILSVGELNRNKNHETVIRAISSLGNKKINYIICGAGSLHTYLEDLIKKLGIEEQVRLLGYRTDIKEICQTADVFAFPSMREGLGLAALEAMASGLPIITSNVHGIVDYSVDGVTGFTCDPTDIKGFAQSIDRLYKSKVNREAMGQHNQDAVKVFDVDNTNKILKNIYKKLEMETIN
ncbi:glycosyltransferase family 4 protein [Priestia aryabhattai]|uniref:glycosyltransferase family 4 protein n=1 Tax=Priestia aryabhattai TaxID=412384 RepID=UPI001C8E532F|nr:glycosyltransferase family 4 protein [Priestia aryabhattai]MBY0029981.1 glycosyltransferase family 4 protein [Priestia aryabhattai]